MSDTIWKGGGVAHNPYVGGPPIKGPPGTPIQEERRDVSEIPDLEAMRKLANVASGTAYPGLRLELRALLDYTERLQAELRRYRQVYPHIHTHATEEMRAKCFGCAVDRLLPPAPSQP